MATQQVEPVEYTVEMANNFWFDFDNRFTTQATPEIGAAFIQIGRADFFRMRWRATRDDGTYPEAFIQEALARAGGLLTISAAQLAVIDQHFGGNAAFEQRAFEDFGQGILFDDRRPVGDKLHKMDIGGPERPPIGYHRWHAIIRAAVIAGVDADRWLQINRLVGLAWAIQSEAKPVEDSQSNPPLDATLLDQLRQRWLGMSAEELDAQFDSFPYPPAPPVVLPLSYATDIQPLFREFDRQEMSFVFDLWNYDDVRTHAGAIFGCVSDGSMPCDGAWPQERIDLFAKWMADGMHP